MIDMEKTAALASARAQRDRAVALLCNVAALLLVGTSPALIALAYRAGF